MAEATFSWGQLADWYQKHGGTERGRRPIVIQIPNPAYDGVTDQRQTIPGEATEITAADGSTIVVQEQPGVPDAVDPNPKPSYIVHSHADSPASVKPSDPGAAAADANAVELQKQRERNAALPPDQDPQYETDAERRARGRQTALDQEAAAARAKAAADKEKADADAAAQRNKPTISYKQVNGTWYQVSTTPDGKETVTPSGLPKEVTPGTVITVDGQPATVVKDDAGNVTGVKILPITGGSKGEPPGRPAPDYSPGNVANSLRAYAAWVNQQRMDGAIDDATATRLVASERALAETAVSEQANATRTATDIYGHQVSERNTDVNASTTRNSTAVGGVNTAFQLVQGGAAAQPKGSDAAYRAFQGLLQTQLQQSQAMGGMNQPPPVPIPAAAQPYMTITSPGGTKVDLHDTAGGTPPAPGVGGTPAIPSRPDVQGPTSGPMPGSVSAESAAAPAGQIPAALAAHADSKPTGNAFADTEMTLTAAGISPAAIAAARERFLAAQTQSAPDAVQTFSQGFQMPALAGA